MASSGYRFPLGYLITPLSGARSPGPLGLFDQADPNMCTLLGDTPGPLGWWDGAQPPHGWPGVGGALPVRSPLGPLAVAPGQAPSVSQAALPSLVLTTAQLKKLFSQSKDELLDKVLQEIARKPLDFGLDTLLRLAHFFAQVREEAGAALQGKVENLNYKADALGPLFSYYKRNPAEAQQDGRLTDPVTKKVTQAANQQNIANKAYANRNGNGNVASGDGWRYRGRGFIQVTGRGNYRELTQQYQALYGAGEGDFEKNPELLEAFPYTLRSAICFWVKHGLAAKADVGATGAAVDSITAVVNKHTPSYAERRHNFETAHAAFSS